MASGSARHEVGSVAGTGADMRLELGFQPRAVHVFNVAAGGLVWGRWMAGMADDSMIKQAANGTTTLPTTNGITPDAMGFSIGADTDLNVAAETMRWEAWE